jgi:hypothetical protein
MNRITATLASAVALTALAACADSGSKVDGPNDLSVKADVSELANAPGANGRHIMLTRGGYPSDNASPNASKTAGGTNTGIYYHGGPVLQSGTKIATIYWASSVIYPGGPTPGTYGAASKDNSLIATVLNSLGNSPYFSINGTYTDGSGRNIVPSLTYTQTWANNSGAPSGTTSISDAQMVAMLQSGITSGAITYDASTLYAIFSSGAVNLGGGFSASGLQYCAYHTHGTVTVNGVAKTILYAAMPYDAQYPQYCTNGTGYPNGDPGADAEVNTLSHETEETTTDMMGTAWFDRRGYENADKCAWTWGTLLTAPNGAKYNVTLGGKNFLIQQNWKNSGSGGCAMHL